MESVRRLLLSAHYDEELEALLRIISDQVDMDLLIGETAVTLDDTESRSQSQSLLEDLLLYFAVRKCGEGSQGREGILGVGEQTLLRWQRHGRQQSQELQSAVSSLQELFLQSDWNAVGVSSLSRVVKRLQDPRVRKNFLVFGFQVLQNSLQHKARESVEGQTKLFDEVSRVLLLGVTDLWSEIRKECARRAVAIVLEFLSHSHIEIVLDSLLSVAIGSKSVSADKSQVTAWTEREGALRMLSRLLLSIKVKYTQSELEMAEVSRVTDDIKNFGRETPRSNVMYRLGRNSPELAQLPRCLVQTLKPAMYQCLRHDQLTVRQLAAQCLVEYTVVCEDPTRLLLFQEVISKLNRIHRNGRAGEIDSGEPELLDAFEAEGLLDVLSRMAPCLPLTFLLKHWKVVFPTLEKYVMHIASSVRQQGSKVVLALAKLSLSSTDDVQATKLLGQMLLSLAQRRRDESEFCWQQKEGRLFSVDVLVNVLGESILLCNDDISMLFSLTIPTSTTAIDGQKKHRWAHDQPQLATWVFEDDPAIGIGNTVGDQSLIETIADFVERNAGRGAFPTSSQAFWQKVLSGFISQTKEAFESPQFELRRISRQLLPGLMRLVIWARQVDFLSSTQLQTASPNEASWCWACVKYILFHLRFLEESIWATNSNVASIASMSTRLATDYTVMWNGICVLNSIVKNSITKSDSETLVATVEAKLLVFLCFGSTTKPPEELVQYLDGSLTVIRVHLPDGFQREQLEAKDFPVSRDGSLDRQFSVFLVPLLPAVVSTFHLLIGRHGGSSFNENGFSRWVWLERIALTWLVCDDMFRWITLNKSEAHSLLIESLRLLLHFTDAKNSIPDQSKEFGLILNGLHSICISNRRIKTSTYTTMLNIYLQMWMQCSQQSNGCQGEIVQAISRLYSQRQQIETKAARNCDATDPWDDWDDDGEVEIQRASPVESETIQAVDISFQEALSGVHPNQLRLLLEAARALPAVQYQHTAKMQQQIEAYISNAN